MTLPASFPISMLQVQAELFNLTGSNQLGSSLVRALANKPSGTISLSDLLGKQAGYTGAITFQMGSGPSFGTLNSITTLGTFFGAGSTFYRISSNVGTDATISFDVDPTWSGNIVLTNTDNGLSVSIPKTFTAQWSIGSIPSGLIPGAALPAGGTSTQNFILRPDA